MRKDTCSRQISENGLKPSDINFTDDAIREIIRSYTREAGVRQLERELGAICRSVATRVADGFNETIAVKPESIPAYLGPLKFFNEIALRTSLPGVATGLAWTPFGGDILFVEATKMAGDGKLILTGQLGDVMKESAQAALSLVKSRAGHWESIPMFSRRTDLQLLPGGRYPRTAPSGSRSLASCHCKGGATAKMSP